MPNKIETTIIYGCDTVQPIGHNKYLETLDSSVNQTFICGGHEGSDRIHGYQIRAISFIGRYLKNAENSSAN